MCCVQSALGHKSHSTYQMKLQLPDRQRDSQNWPVHIFLNHPDPPPLLLLKIAALLYTAPSLFRSLLFFFFLTTSPLHSEEQQFFLH